MQYDPRKLINVQIFHVSSELKFSLLKRIGESGSRVFFFFFFIKVSQIDHFVLDYIIPEYNPVVTKRVLFIPTLISASEFIQTFDPQVAITYPRIWRPPNDGREFDTIRIYLKHR